nr:uncharacterized protein CI109_005505 [Kwoniella shandongensis]KAA5526073.1 hypothetical protein CI109_005505 [Kwoniella shandongensis]
MSTPSYEDGITERIHQEQKRLRMWVSADLKPADISYQQISEHDDLMPEVGQYQVTASADTAHLRHARMLTDQPVHINEERVFLDFTELSSFLENQLAYVDVPVTGLFNLKQQWRASLEEGSSVQEPRSPAEESQTSDGRGQAFFRVMPSQPGNFNGRYHRGDYVVKPCSVILTGFHQHYMAYAAVDQEQSLKMTGDENQSNLESSTQMRRPSNPGPEDGVILGGRSQYFFSTSLKLQGEGWQWEDRMLMAYNPSFYTQLTRPLATDNCHFVAAQRDKQNEPAYALSYFEPIDSVGDGHLHRNPAEMESSLSKLKDSTGEFRCVKNRSTREESSDESDGETTIKALQSL